MKSIFYCWGIVWGVMAWPVIILLCLMYAIAELRWSAFNELLERF